jgi:hypothetical protein
VPFGKIREKFRKKEKTGYLLVLCVLSIVFIFTKLRYVSTRLSQQLWFVL